MNNEERSEIIKALSYGYSAVDIAKVVDVTAEEVEKIAAEEAAEIENMKNYHVKMEG